MTPERKQKIMVNVLVIIGFAVIMGVIVWPIFARAHEPCYPPNCLAQIRQLSTCVQMYVQDNHDRYPGLRWNEQLDGYAGTHSMFECSRETMEHKLSPISYGYNVALVLPNGAGMYAARVTNPAKVGAIVDAKPARLWEQGGGLVGHAPKWPDRLVTPFAHQEDPKLTCRNQRHVPENPNQPLRTGYHLAYCDGHAEIVPTRAAVDQAFIRAQTLGYLK